MLNILETSSTLMTEYKQFYITLQFKLDYLHCCITQIRIRIKIRKIKPTNRNSTCNIFKIRKKAALNQIKNIKKTVGA